MFVKIFQIPQNLKSTYGSSYKEGRPTVEVRIPSYQDKYSLKVRQPVRL
jgi:hypothetical protein